jgi:hypothetical protein
LPIPRSAAGSKFWFFQYDSGNPVALSSLLLRAAMTAGLAQLDPGGTDPALRNMVLVGHSQGGLLVKMQVISTGDRRSFAAGRSVIANLVRRLISPPDASADLTADFVRYSSAHIEPVESELVVKSGHSVPGNSHAIEEVRRILRVHARLQ